MSSYFEGAENQEKKTYIPPDYSEETPDDFPRDEDDDDDDDDVDDDEPSDIDEGKEETEQDKALGNKEMVTGQGSTNPFSTPVQNNTPSWGTPSWGTPAGGGWKPQTTNIWGSSGNSGYGQSNQWGQTGQKTELNREKKVIFCDFLDCIVETWQSNGQPGLLPRDIYDLKPKFDVWDKIRAFSPERVYAIIPKNLLSSSTNGAPGWEATLNYFCCGLSAYLRKPFPCCQILSQSVIGQQKEELIMSALENNRKPIPKEIAILIGINSGLYGMSNVDKIAAQLCGIDYIDLNELLTLTY